MEGNLDNSRPQSEVVNMNLKASFAGAPQMEEENQMGRKTSAASNNTGQQQAAGQMYLPEEESGSGDGY